MRREKQLKRLLHEKIAGLAALWTPLSAHSLSAHLHAARRETVARQQRHTVLAHTPHATSIPVHTRLQPALAQCQQPAPTVQVDCGKRGRRFAQDFPLRRRELRIRQHKHVPAAAVLERGGGREGAGEPPGARRCQSAARYATAAAAIPVTVPSQQQRPKPWRATFCPLPPHTPASSGPSAPGTRPGWSAVRTAGSGLAAPRPAAGRHSP